MKVRIVRAPKGEIDGIRIDLFYVGLTYDMSATLATVLVCEGYAEPVLEFDRDRRETTLKPAYDRAADRRRPS